MTKAEIGVKKVLITEQEIKDKIKDYGRIISQEYQGKNLLLVSVLKGAFMFMADLLREIDIPCQIDFMCVSSYGNGTKSTGNIKITKDLGVDINGLDVLIVEDILDSGNTLYAIKNLLLERNPKSLKIVTLLDKPERREADIKTDYTLFTIPDEFVIGYGLDCAEKYRNLKYIGVYDTSLL